jgi:hypothetical protein
VWLVLDPRIGLKLYDGHDPLGAAFLTVWAPLSWIHGPGRNAILDVLGTGLQ